MREIKVHGYLADGKNSARLGLNYYQIIIIIKIVFSIMIAQRILFIKGKDLWSFMAVANEGTEESKGRDLMRKSKARSLCRVLSYREASGRHPP